MLAKSGSHHLHSAVNMVCALAVIFLSYHLFLSNYYYSNFLWGTPVNILRTDDGVIKLITELEVMEVTLQKLETEVKRLRKLTTQLTLQQKYSNHHLYDRLVEVDKTSNLNPILLERLGPYSNINLPDRSGSIDAVASLNSYDLIIRQQMIEGIVSNTDGLEILAILKELRENFQKTQQYQAELKQKLAMYYASKETAYFMLTPQYEELEPVQPVNPYSSMNISDHEASILYKGHHLMGTVSETQLKLVQTTYELMDALSKLMHYREVVRLGEESALYRVSSSGDQLVTFLFMEDRAIETVKSGDPIFRCRLGTFGCYQVGIIKQLYTQQQQTYHPYTGKVVNGFLAEVELNGRAGRTRIFHIKHQPFE